MLKCHGCSYRTIGDPSCASAATSASAADIGIRLERSVGIEGAFRGGFGMCVGCGWTDLDSLVCELCVMVQLAFDLWKVVEGMEEGLWRDGVGDLE